MAIIKDRDETLSYGSLVRSLEIGDAVGRLLVGPELQHATGFVVPRRVLLTCDYVMPDPKAAAVADFQLRFRLDPEGRVTPPVHVRLKPEEFFACEPSLGVTAVALDPEDLESAGLGLSSLELPGLDRPLLIGDGANLIYHPFGQPQRYSIGEGSVLNITDERLHYDAPTFPGTGGAPIFDAGWELVGIHYSKVPNRNESGEVLDVNGDVWNLGGDQARVDWIANEGVRITGVLEWLRQLEVSKEVLSLERGPLQEPGRNQAAVVEVGPLPDVRPSGLIEDGGLDSGRSTVFISYSRGDQVEDRWHDYLERQLRSMQSVGPTNVWQDGHIKAGDRWLEEIEQGLRLAKVAVLLVGPHFLNSEFVLNRELPELMAAAVEDGVRVFPLATHNVVYEDSVLAEFQFFGDPEQPLEMLEPAQARRVIVDLARAIGEEFST